MENSREVTLASVSQIVSSLRSVVASFYGPQCSQTLLTSRTGKAVVTSDGYTIVEALSPDHPVACLVFQTLKQCHDHTLDGSKVFLLYLDHILRELLLAIEQGKFDYSGICRAGRKEQFNKQGALCAKQQVQKLISEVVPFVYKYIILHGQHVYDTVLTDGSFQQTISGVCKTALMPHYSQRVCRFLAKTLVSSLPEELSEEFISSLNTITEKFYSLVVKISNRPYAESTVFEPFLMKRKMSVKCEGFGSTPIKAVMLTSGLDETKSEEQRKELFHVKQEGQITKLLLSRQKAVEAFATTCKKFEINLLLCTENVPPYAADIFHRNGITVIPFVFEEDVQVIETLTDKLTLHSVHDEITDSNLVPLRGVTEVTIGGEMYIQLNTGEVPWKHLILCGPTVGLCDQVAMMCHKALCALKHCFMTTQELEQHKIEDESGSSDDSFEENESDFVDECVNEGEGVNVDEGACVEGAIIDQSEQDSCVHDLGKISIQENDKCTELVEDATDKMRGAENENSNNNTPESNLDKMVFIQGGGSFEILASHLLQYYQSKCKDSNLVVMCNALRQALINVVNVLFSNTIKISGNKREFTEVLTLINETFLDKGELWGLDRGGKPMDLAVRCVFEPVKSKMHILECVLNLVVQLLGLDQIISVKKLKDDDDDQ